jgi:hypothetical protein
MPHDTRIIRQLLTDALSDDQLTALCYDDFHPVYETFSSSQNKPQKIHILIEHCERHNCIDELLACVERQNPAKYAEYKGRLIGSVNLPRISSFDLDQLVRECLAVLLEQRGLIGFAIPCDDDGFLKNFCERLKDELDRSNTQIRDCLGLKPQHTSVERAIATIKRYEKSLQSGNVLCPVRVPDDNEAIVSTFWQRLCNEFKGKFEHRLVLMMAGGPDCAFPDGTIKLSPPRFAEVDVFQWVGKVTDSLKWSSDVRHKWTNRVMKVCCYGNTLNMRYVYDHLDDALKILQKKPTVEHFFKALE